MRYAIDTVPMPDLLTPQQVADLTRISPQTLANWRCTRRAGPPFLKLGGRFVRYEKRAVLDWLRASTVQPDQAQ
jgi:predicted DNA-binding transcriptional regulator AlpA